MELIEKESLDKIKEKTLNNEFGTGIIRERKLGEIYPVIQNLINIEYGYPKRYDDSKILKKIALNILKGQFDETKIKTNLGEKNYPNKIIEEEKKKGIQQLESELLIKPKPLTEGKEEEKLILILAKEIIEGIHGDGEKRRNNIEKIYEKEFPNKLLENLEEKQKKFSEFYEKVRNKVNEILDKDCDEAKSFYERINELAEKVCELYNKGNLDEIKEIKNKNIHDFPLIKYVVKIINPDFEFEEEKSTEIELIANEVVNGNFFEGQQRINVLKFFDEELYENVKKEVSKIYAKIKENNKSEKK